MKFKLISLLLFLIITLVFTRVVFAEENVETLRNQIEEKNEELKSLEAQRREYEEKLEEAGEKKYSLQREISSIDWQISQLEVSMRSNELTIEKLKLEQESLSNDVKNIEKNINNKQDTVAKLFVELQQKDNESFLTILLKNNTLAESVFEIQSMVTLGDSLTSNVKELRNLQDELVKKSNKITEKKENVEVEQKTMENRQYLIANKKEDKKYLLNKTKSEEQLYQEKVDEIEKQQMEISNIMTQIEERLRLELDSSLLPSKRAGLLAYPVKSDSCVTQFYGATEFAKKAYRTKFHTGIDFRAPTGDPIFAVYDGVVTVVDDNDKSSWEKYQYGKYVMIEHDNNLSSFYAHLSKQVVSEGQEVKKGDIIGYSGNTGYSFGAHLHFGLYATPVMGWQKSYSSEKARENGGLISIPPAAGLVPVGATLNPMDYMNPMSSCY
jgi:murein DD-endopeptidase MepM/ murein hydrolase activator NlpD